MRCILDLRRRHAIRVMRRANDGGGLTVTAHNRVTAYNSATAVATVDLPPKKKRRRRRRRRQKK
jgi:hypothetical protein